MVDASIMTTRTSRSLFVVVLLACSCLLAEAEIHRARAVNTKPYHPGRTAALHRRIQRQQELSSESGWLDGLRQTYDWWSNDERAQIWTFSLLAAALVGLSGIFPLLVIPLEAGEALRKGGAATERLQLFLSFAVGGLLGDVFLHLLPEAWAHLDKLGGPHEGNIEIGCWVLTGLLAFMIIEKLFPESEDVDDDEEDITLDEDLPLEFDSDNLSNSLKEQQYLQKTKEALKEGLPNGYTDGIVTRNGYVREMSETNGCLQRKTESYLKKGYLKPSNEQVDELSGQVKNGCLLNGKVTEVYNEVCRMIHGADHVKNGCVMNGKVSEPTLETMTAAKQNSAHIKTSGWLNLMANMIDNFTHGLAIAGSFSVGIKTGMVTALAILLHEVPHEIGDFAILLRAGFDRWRAAKAQLLTATGGMLGAAAALLAESAESAGDRTAWILPFTSGGFIYIAMVTVLPDLLRAEKTEWQSFKQFGLLCTGIAVMAAITVCVD